MELFKYDSPFMTGFRRVVDYMFLGLLWVIASLPILTFGAATAAALRTAEVSIRQNDGGIFKPFWSYFRQEFKQATILWIIELPVLEFVLVDLLIVRYLKVPAMVQILIIVMCLLAFCWLQLWFGYQSRIKDKIGMVLLNTFRMTMSNFGRTLLMAVLTVVCIVGAYFALFLLPPLLLIIPGTYITVYTYLLRKIFARYKTADDEVQAEATE